MTGSSNLDVVLQVEEVDFSYDQTQVLFGITLRVHKGESLALIGTNGSGKSTLLRVIAGIEKPNKGRITYLGRAITGVPPNQLPGDGLVTVVGGRAAFVDMTVEENLTMQATAAHLNRNDLKGRLDNVFSTFPTLAAHLRQKAGTLSGGEQHQLALAKALLLNPKVLCIDELSLGLAPIVVKELLELVWRIRSSGVALVVVDQNPTIAAEVSDRAVLLETGRVKFEGPSQALVERGGETGSVLSRAGSTWPPALQIGSQG